MLLFVILFITPLTSSRIIQQSSPKDSFNFLENIYTYFNDNPNSLQPIYQNAQLFNTFISIYNSRLFEDITESLSSSKKSKRAVTEHIPKLINNWMVPQIYNKIQIEFKNFQQSALWKRINENVDVNRFQKAFLDETGDFSYDIFVESMENHSFRKYWIAVLTKKVSDYIYLYVNETTHEKFFTLVLSPINDFLHKSGIPKDCLLNVNNLEESSINLTNYIFNPIDTKKYINPIKIYIQNLISTTRDNFNPEKLEETLTDTVNMDLIEPVLRVNRAYRFLIQNPLCDRYVMCVVNREERDDPRLPGVKKVLSKGASLVAGWFLAGKSRSPFSDLYRVVIDEVNCEDMKIRLNCEGFHFEELRVKMPYVHKEL